MEISGKFHAPATWHLVKELLVSAKYQPKWALEPIGVLWRKYLLPLSEIESWFLRHLAHSLVTKQTVLSKLWYHICNKTNNTHTTDTTPPWPKSASELYQQSGRRRSAKLVPTFAERGVSRGQRNGSPRPLISVFWTGAATFFYSSSSSIDLTRLSGPRSRPTTTQKIW